MFRRIPCLLALALCACHDGSSQAAAQKQADSSPTLHREAGAEVPAAEAEIVEREGYAARRAVPRRGWFEPVLVIEPGEPGEPASSQDIALILSGELLERFDAHLGRRVRVRGHLLESATGTRLVASAALEILPAEPARVHAIAPHGRWPTPALGEALLAFAGPIGRGGEGELAIFRGERSLGLRHTQNTGREYSRAELTIELGDHLDGIRDVVFVDADHDTELEVVILTEQMTGVGPKGAVPFTVPVVVDLEAHTLQRRPDLEHLLEGVSLARDVRARFGAAPQPRDGLDAAWSCALRVDPAACSGPRVSERPWARHALALARAGGRDLPWTMAGLVALLGEGEPEPTIGGTRSRSRRWFAAGEWLIATPDPHEPGRVTTSWVPDEPRP